MLLTVIVQIQKCWVVQRNTLKKQLLYLNITNSLVVFPQICYIEVFDIGIPRYNGQISPVPWHFIKSRFHCTPKKLLNRDDWMDINKISGNFSGIHGLALLPTVSSSNWNLEMLVFVEGGHNDIRANK